MGDTSRPIMTHQTHDVWHELIFHESSYAAIDALYVKLEQFFQGPLDQKVRVLVDMTQSGGLPIVYGYQKIRPLMTRYPKRPPTRYVFISANRIDLTHLVKSTVLAIYPQINANYFGAGERQSALRWLLDD